MSAEHEQLVADYCVSQRWSASDVRGFGGLRRIDVAHRAGLNDTLSKAGWSAVCKLLAAGRVEVSQTHQEGE